MSQYLGCAQLQFGLVHISAGDLLRAEVAAGTSEGKEAASYMDSGNLVPNSVVVEMVTNRLSQPDVQEHGWLLDGYPRSGDQAEAIVQKGIRPDLFVLISVSVFALFSCIAPILVAFVNLHYMYSSVLEMKALHYTALQSLCASFSKCSATSDNMHQDWMMSVCVFRCLSAHVLCVMHVHRMAMAGQMGFYSMQQMQCRFQMKIWWIE